MLLYQLTKVKEDLNSVSHYENNDFAYAVFINKKLIDKELTKLNFIKNISPEVEEYEQKRLELCEKFSKKNDNGESIIENNIYLIDDQETFLKEIEILLQKYKEPVENRQKQIELFNDMMNEQVDLPFVKINKTQIPPEIKTANDLEKISFMIDLDF